MSNTRFFYKHNIYKNRRLKSGRKLSMYSTNILSFILQNKEGRSMMLATTVKLCKIKKNDKHTVNINKPNF